MNNKYFTKSAYKVAIDCPTKLFYCCDDNYANQDSNNEFLMALAKGGFQVGELAKIYYHITDDTFVKSQDYDESVSQTVRLFERNKVNIAEAAFRFENLFVRADIIQKDGNKINLIEVKAKSFDSRIGTSITPKNSGSEMLPYIKDVAFQKYVICNSLKLLYPEKPFEVHAYLLMADKAKCASVNGMNQYFKINGDDSKCKISNRPGAEKLANEEHVLTAFDVNDYCDEINTNPDTISFITRMAEAYCNHTRISSQLSHKCFKCSFISPDNSKLDGYKECWKEQAGFIDSDFDRPQIKDFSMFGFWRVADELIRQRKYFMNELTIDDLSSKYASSPLRRDIQLGIETQNQKILSKYADRIIDGKIYFNKDGFLETMSKWTPPYHMIDFETSAVALPFYKGMRPYEDVAFQFSHHVIRLNEDGTYQIEHCDQYLNTEKGFFPNFEFIRRLKDSLSKDNGTIFRYSNHENKILRSIRTQLLESDEPDRDELIVFIESITHSTKDEPVHTCGERDMVDLEKVVKDFFIFPEIMKGRTSIKVVLPAVLNASKFLRDKYSKPIYGTDIKSCNYTSKGVAVSWIKEDPISGRIDNPYHELEAIETEILKNSELSDDEFQNIKREVGETVANGGAALTAYSKLQFSDLVATDVLKNALLRYCELDTMAMVFIWEYFYNESR